MGGFQCCPTIRGKQRQQIDASLCPGSESGMKFPEQTTLCGVQFLLCTTIAGLTESSPKGMQQALLLGSSAAL